MVSDSEAKHMNINELMDKSIKKINMQFEEIVYLKQELKRKHERVTQLESLMANVMAMFIAASEVKE